MTAAPPRLDEAKRRERAEQQRLQRKLEAMRYEDAVQAQLGTPPAHATAS